MFYKLRSFLLGSFATLLLIFNLLFFSTLTLLGALFSKIIPKSALKTKLIKFSFIPPSWWMKCNEMILKMCTQKKWFVEGEGVLETQGSYLLISNHESWIDIPILGSVFNRKIPLIKFFMKRELLFQLPIAGLASYLLGYPMMARYSRAQIRKNPALKNRDLIATQKAYEKFKEYPTAFMIFAEGTRFTEEKRKKTASPYKNLLPPKTAALALILNEMRAKLTAVIDITLHYDADQKSLWHFLSGQTNKVYVHYQLIDPAPLLIKENESHRDYRKRLQQWINNVWKEKDEQIERLKRKKTE